MKTFPNFLYRVYFGRTLHYRNPITKLWNWQPVTKVSIGDAKRVAGTLNLCVQQAGLGSGVTDGGEHTPSQVALRSPLAWNRGPFFNETSAYLVMRRSVELREKLWMHD